MYLVPAIMMMPIMYKVTSSHTLASENVAILHSYILTNNVLGRCSRYSLEQTRIEWNSSITLFYRTAARAI